MLAAAATPTPAFGNMTSAFGDSMGMAPVVGLIVVIALVIIGLVSSARFYRAVLNASGHFARSFEYAIKGVATALVLAVFSAPFYLFSQLDGGTRELVYQAVGALIFGYIALVVLGFVGDRVWKRVVNQHRRVTGNRPFEGLKSIESDD